jgi:hypothetical protein
MYIEIMKYNIIYRKATWLCASPAPYCRILRRNQVAIKECEKKQVEFWFSWRIFIVQKSAFNQTLMWIKKVWDICSVLIRIQIQTWKADTNPGEPKRRRNVLKRNAVFRSYTSHWRQDKPRQIQIEIKPSDVGVGSVSDLDPDSIQIQLGQWIRKHIQNPYSRIQEGKWQTKI